jgi:hypothetical protein
MSDTNASVSGGGDNDGASPSATYTYPFKNWCDWSPQERVASAIIEAFIPGNPQRMVDTIDQYGEHHLVDYNTLQQAAITMITNTNNHNNNKPR